MNAATALPLSAHELRDAMRDAQRFDATRLDRVLRLEPARGEVEVQAHTPWQAIAAQLRPGDAQAAAVRTTMPTVGESIARNAAGPDGRPAVLHVEALALVTPDGQLRRASRHVNRQLFALVVGRQGLFGALYSVTLSLDSLARAVSEANIAPPAPRAADAIHLLVPPDRLDACIAEARARCHEWRIAIDALDVRRTLPEEDTFLRWARRDYAELSLRLPRACTLAHAVRLTQLRRELIDGAIAHGGGFPIDCTPEATRAQAEACYPQLKTFLAEKRRFDPAERWVNDWYRHHRGLLARAACAVRWAN